MVKILNNMLVTCWLLHDIVFCYYVVSIYFYSYVIVYQKGYQDTDLVVSSVTTKMKGTAMASDDQLWDVADYVVPPEVSQSSCII